MSEIGEPYLADLTNLTYLDVIGENPISIETVTTYR
jgi:hypothetical protein